jgi:hypothetical protein
MFSIIPASGIKPLEKWSLELAKPGRLGLVGLFIAIMGRWIDSLSTV